MSGVRDTRGAVTGGKAAPEHPAPSDLLGDQPVMRHTNNLESACTDEVPTLVLGDTITGIPAFR